jgi:hypothetical protein
MVPLDVSHYILTPNHCKPIDKLLQAQPWEFPNEID